MQVGLIGAGNMARALARGWGDPVLVSDGGSGRAKALADELGGEALDSNVAVADRADLVVLCHKPAQFTTVAAETRGSRQGGRVGAQRDRHREAARGVRRARCSGSCRTLRSRSAAGSICYAPEREVDAALEGEVLELFGRLGTVVEVPERLMPAAGAVVGVGPAYQALLVEAQVDAAVRHGLAAGLAGRLVAETMAGTAALLHTRDYDTLAVRREVASPGGTTARGLAALERGGVRPAFQDAIDAVVGSGLLMLVAAVTRGDIANYVQALFLVYILLIFVYILLNMMFSLGLRPPYSRYMDAIMNFLRDVCEPYLKIFRRFIPPIGMFDLTPMIAIIVLYIVRTVVVNLISG